MDPHFLHGARVLEPVLVPPVEQPAALAWRPGTEALLLATRAGAVFEVEPTAGTRKVLQLDREPALISALPDGGALVLTVEGLLQRWGEGGRRWEVATGLLAGRGLAVTDEAVAVVGDDGVNRRVLLFDRSGVRRLRARVPARTAIGVDERGRLVWARSLETGLAVVPIGDPLAGGAATQHQVTVGPGGVVGVTEAGVVVWQRGGALAVRQGDVGNVALNAEGTLLALGTRGGSVALVDLAEPGQRRSPARVEGHAGPVRGMSFAPRGRWLATIGDRCRVWTCATPTPSTAP